MTVSKTVALPLGYTPKGMIRIVYGKLFFSSVYFLFFIISLLEVLRGFLNISLRNPGVKVER